MSGDAVPQGPAGPIELSDEDVAQLAGARRSRVAALTRLKAEVPTAPVGALETRAATPVKLSKSELAAARRQGRLPEKVAARRAASEPPAAAPDSEDGPLPDAPTEVPPSARKAPSAKGGKAKAPTRGKAKGRSA